jgi:hypothetical protein
MKLLLAFLLLVIVGAMWETGRDRPLKAFPLLALCAVLAVAYLSLDRLV